MLINDNWNGTQVLFDPNAHVLSTMLTSLLMLNSGMSTCQGFPSEDSCAGTLLLKNYFFPPSITIIGKTSSSTYMIKHQIKLLFIYSNVDFQSDQFYSAIFSLTLNSTSLTQMAYHYK